MPLMLDLFSGTGQASEPFRAAGWEVVRVEIDPSFEAEVHADVAHWSWSGAKPRLIWASPPCTEFSRESMPWCRTGKPPSLDLVAAAVRIIRECDPDFWVIENVKGATRYLTPFLGRPLCLGPVRLFGRFPRFRRSVPPWKERLSSKQRVRRAAMPLQIGQGLLEAINGILPAFYAASPPPPALPHT